MASPVSGSQAGAWEPERNQASPKSVTVWELANRSYLNILADSRGGLPVPQDRVHNRSELAQGGWGGVCAILPIRGCPGKKGAFGKVSKCDFLSESRLPF